MQSVWIETLYAWSFIEYFGEYFNSKQRRKITCDVRKSLRIAMNFLCCLRIIFSNPLRDEFCTVFVCFCFFVVVAATRWNVKICKNDIAFFTDPILNCFWIFHVANTWSQWKKIIFSQVGFFRAFSHFAGIFQCCNLRNFLSQRRYFISRGNLLVLKFLEFFFEHFHIFPIHALFFINKHEKSLSNWQIHNWKAVWDETCKHSIRFLCFYLLIYGSVEENVDVKFQNILRWIASWETKIYWRRAFLVLIAMITGKSIKVSFNIL